MNDAGVSISDHIYLKYTDSISRKINGDWIYEVDHDLHKTFSKFKEQDITYQWHKKYLYEDFPTTIKDLKINGNDLMKIGIPAGKKIGETLDKLYTMVLAEEISNDNEALSSMAMKWHTVNVLEKMLSTTT